MCASNDAPAYDLPDEPGWIDPRDAVCDSCLRTIYDGSIRAEVQGGSTMFVCGDCRQKAAARYAAMTGGAA